MSKKEKKSFSETIDEATDKIDEVAVKAENEVKKTVEFFKTSWKWLLSDVICLTIGFALGVILL